MTLWPSTLATAVRSRSGSLRTSSSPTRRTASAGSAASSARAATRATRESPGTQTPAPVTRPWRSGAAGPASYSGRSTRPPPATFRHVLVYRKPPDAGAVGSTTGYRRDLEPVFLTGPWPLRAVERSSLVATAARGQGHLCKIAGHPHAKPVDTLEALISACPPGVIADPFAGSGSTLVAARNLGRRAIGVELDERYAELAARRLSQMTLSGAG